MSFVGIFLIVFIFVVAFRPALLTLAIIIGAPALLLALIAGSGMIIPALIATTFFIAIIALDNAKNIRRDIANIKGNSKFNKIKLQHENDLEKNIEELKQKYNPILNYMAINDITDRVMLCNTEKYLEALVNEYKKQKELYTNDLDVKKLSPANYCLTKLASINTSIAKHENQMNIIKDRLSKLS